MSRVFDYMSSVLGARAKGAGAAVSSNLVEDEAPLRTELLSVEQLERHAKALAGWHQADERGGGDKLLRRLAENEKVLEAAYHYVAKPLAKHERRVPAEEWLLDNFHLVQMQIRTTRLHLPRSYSRQLPNLMSGTSAGNPRVYDIALELISHCDGVVDKENLERFIEAYQSVTPLTLGELWAIPIMLRLALIENLRRVSARITWQREQQVLAEHWAGRLIRAGEMHGDSVIIILSEMVRSKPPLNSAFVPHIIRRLHGRSAAISPAIDWIEQRLAERGQASETLIQVASQNEATDQLAIGNSISSLRAIGSMDWRGFVESMSIVEQTLRQDEAGVYAQSSFAARDRCRHVVERLARRCECSEVEVARRAVKMAQPKPIVAAAEMEEPDERLRHVGYFLIDEGITQFEQVLGYRPSLGERIRRRLGRNSLTWYLGSVFLLTELLVAVAVSLGVVAGIGMGWVIAVGILVAIGGSQLALSLVNLAVTRWVAPKGLAKLDFDSGIPDEHRTIVVVPTMIDTDRTVDSLIEAMEVRYLANRDRNLYFGLLTDFPDSEGESLETDQRLLDRMSVAIERLNEQYAYDRPGIFSWFHRPRLYNEQERRWMAWERKRGKLEQFNALLRRGEVEAFNAYVGDIEHLRSIRYVITLDTDTQLPRDMAKGMVGTMAHPLNRPHVDSATGLVTRGYGILQPRVACGLAGANRSSYAALMSGDAGLDPYTRQVSDVYQDLFSEGSFTGKGIYDVDAFEKSLDGRFPDNWILSHDLIESSFARSALISDVQVVEDYPAGYLADVSRRHRWIRGDWQISPWVLPKSPDVRWDWVRNPLSALARWKVFDNLRRSLVYGSLTILAVLIWLAVPTMAWYAMALIAGVACLPKLINLGTQLVHKGREIPWLIHLGTVLDDSWRAAKMVALDIAVMPYEGYVNLDAMARSLWRMVIRRTRMLEWRTSSEAERTARRDLIGHVRAMWVGPGLAIGMGLALWKMDRGVALVWAAPILILWLVGPVIAWQLSRESASVIKELSSCQKPFLRRVSRLTWRFFEKYVTEETHWLPPDNVQEEPISRVDTRTSPTNIGMGLVGNLAAYDFGYICVGDLMDRTTRTFDSLDQMERFRGHFYNWYETTTLEALPPHYISSVDSGNMAGHLLTLGMGFEELSDASILPPGLFAGLDDTFELLFDSASGKWAPANMDTGEPIDKPIMYRLNRIKTELASGANTLTGAYALLEELVAESKAVRAAIEDVEVSSDEVKWWASAFENQCKSFKQDLARLAPWLALPVPSHEVLERIPSVVRQQFEGLDHGVSLRGLARLSQDFGEHLQGAIDASRASDEDSCRALTSWLEGLHECVSDASDFAAGRMNDLTELGKRCEEFAEMEFRFLYNEETDLLRIGFNTFDHRGDESHYDLLASEARLASYLAIANGQLPQEHWFVLGRQVTLTAGHMSLISWSGSMFEYLMPLLVMPTYANTLLDETYKACVRRQIQWGKQRGVPWGVSESCYGLMDGNQVYQYQAFGVPGLGLKRGLSDDLVMAPYASAMSLMVLPDEAARNLQRFSDEQMLGQYGFYESVDYTRIRQTRGQDRIPVRMFMSHHSGMSLLAFAYVLLDQPMQRRFMANPSMRAAELLLQERPPRNVEPVYPHAVEARRAEGESVTAAPSEIRVFTSANTRTPQVHLLSNGSYHVMLTNSGGGYSRLGDMAVTRWKEDSTRDCFGQFCYLRDVDTGQFWSTAFQPTLAKPDRYEAIFSQGRVEFKRVDHEILTHTEIAVSPEDDVEIRRVTLTNQSRKVRRIELTSYAEVVLSPPMADSSHPAFNKLFVQTQIISERHAVLATRRPRTPHDKHPLLLHLMAVSGPILGDVEFETDRSQFVGRTHTLSRPAAMERESVLSGSDGSVLDPLVAIRRVVELQPDESIKVDIVTGVAPTHEAAESLLSKYHDHHFTDRVFDLAWSHSQLLLQHLSASEADAQLFARMAGSIIYSNQAYRARPSVLRANRQGQPSLWSYGISGDWPIVLLIATDQQHLSVIRQALQAHTYWRNKGLVVDLVILNDDYSGYRTELHDAIMGMVQSGPDATMIDRPGGIFLRRGEQLTPEDRTLLNAVARIVLTDTGGDLSEQAERRGRSQRTVPRFETTRSVSDAGLPDLPAKQPLLFGNGLGGFTTDGKEYIVTLNPGEATPAPWSNVIANDRFGTVVSETGMGYTWFENAHEYRLTPWHNDPVTDINGEAIYIRDEQTGRFWSPTPLPARGSGQYVTRHGFGYTVYETMEADIESKLKVFVSTESPVKFFSLKLTNLSGRARSISVTGFFELILGHLKGQTAMHVNTEVDPKTGAIFARNHFNADFPGRVTFANVTESMRTMTGDRMEFIGRNGTMASPEAMRRSHLSGRLGAGLDPCAALQVKLDLQEGQTRELVFMLGAGSTEHEARDVIRRYHTTSAPRQALENVWDFWGRTLGTVYVETPDKTIDVLINGWLVYQTLSCRIWGRSGYYQSGGAFGYRDQLQDCMALLHSAPQVYRGHLIYSASRQFVEGDVQHWWHPPTGRGVRTRIRDDYLWLPAATARYVTSTGDTGVLDETATFLHGRPVPPTDESYYDLPGSTEDKASLYEHCVRAIENGLQFGRHGLPVMGCGDWNDGMNEVGFAGKGESVWLGFFLYDVLNQFAPIAMNRGDVAFAERCVQQAEQLRENIEKNAWDGNWYRRAYFDDGTPLGSVQNDECQIDALPQAWSAITGCGDERRTRKALQNVSERLVRRDIGIIQLFDPPFDKSKLEPGYIKGYVPGVRENGGQYTHAAVWTAMAFSAIGDVERAWECLKIMNPVAHSLNPEMMRRYKVEPYVLAADVYGVTPHEGRGGWTWYTGSAGWLYRLICEHLLGLRLEVNRLKFVPCLPDDWDGYSIVYRYRQTHYHIRVNATGGHENHVTRVVVDGADQDELSIPLVDDCRDHHAVIDLN